MYDDQPIIAPRHLLHPSIAGCGPKTSVGYIRPVNYAGAGMTTPQLIEWSVKQALSNPSFVKHRFIDDTPLSNGVRARLRAQAPRNANAKKAIQLIDWTAFTYKRGTAPKVLAEAQRDQQARLYIPGMSVTGLSIAGDAAPANAPPGSVAGPNQVHAVGEYDYWSDASIAAAVTAISQGDVLWTPEMAPYNIYWDANTINANSAPIQAQLAKRQLSVTLLDGTLYDGSYPIPMTAAPSY